MSLLCFLGFRHENSGWVNITTVADPRMFHPPNWVLAILLMGVERLGLVVVKEGFPPTL